MSYLLVLTRLLVASIYLTCHAQAFPAEDYWAVLVAGSKGFYNYRHQADVCHAYQLIKEQGIPEDHIIVMAYNDVAWHSENPFPGQLFNTKDGADVYKNCTIDYEGSEVSKTNFEAILRGDSSALNVNVNSTRKVLKSNSLSKVFLFFADHGAPGHILFPDSLIFADELNTTF
jgi:legumain